MEKYSSFSCTCIGASHHARNLICQDYSFEANNENFVFAATADGHGSLQYLRTEKGSEFAVRAAYECAESFVEGIEGAEEVLDDEKKRHSLFEQLWKDIVERWNELTYEDYSQHPFTEEELDRIPERFSYYREMYESGDYADAYGTTLAFAVVTETYAFCMQIGDGTCVSITREGRAEEPVPPDMRCHDNITTSLCQEEAALLGRCAYFAGDDIPAAIFMGTDGIEKSYWDHTQLWDFYKGLSLAFVRNGLDEGFDQLTEFLPELSRMGSGDDVSCAGIYNAELLEACEDELKIASAEEEEPVTVELKPEMLQNMDLPEAGEDSSIEKIDIE
ncbi:MAG: protein phosphatase 2C domain-containing protein [Ruminococcus sp.]|nr:protein phosphatase 2C domain-containing protein [Ruminococcus sp.]